MQSHGFDIKVIDEIDAIKFVEPYPIVVCDISGVGRAFKSKFEGAHVIKEIRKLYPDKIIIAFSGKTFDASYNEYFGMSDRVVKKDADLDFWVEALDEAIKDYSNPAKQWTKMRNILLKHEISLKRLLQLEDHFVRCCLAGKEPFVSDPRMLRKIPKEVRDLLTTISANLITKILVGN